MSWSHGEVTKPETINYRTLRPERMGHIKLASPVSHVWYFKGIPSRLGLLLDMSPRNLEKILYFANYIVTEVHEEIRAELLANLSVDTDEEALRLRGAIDAKADEIRRQHEELHRKLKDEIEAEVAQLQREYEETVELLTQQGQQIQEAIRSGLGTKARRNLVIGPPGDEEVVVVKGETIAEDMVQATLRKVQEKIERVEANIRAQQETARARLARAETELEEAIADATSEQRDALDRFGRAFKGSIGAEAVRELLARIDLDQEMYRLRDESRTASGQRRQKAIKRLKVVEDFRKSQASPTWMILEVLPVIPPELRPMVQLDGGRFATSDL